MYLILICLAMTASALPVPDERPVRDTYSPSIVTAPDKILRTNLLATYLVPSNGVPHDYGLKHPIIQIKRKPIPIVKDVDRAALTDPTKICNKAESNEIPLFPFPIFSSGSGSFTLTDEEPEKESPELAEVATEEMSEPTELKEPTDTEPEEMVEPADIKEPLDNKPEEVSEPVESKEPDTEREESPEQEGENYEQFAEKESSPAPAPVLPVSPILMPLAPELPKPKPPFFSFKPPFFSFFYPSWFSGKPSARFSLSSIPLLSNFNLQDLPELTSSTLSNLGLSSTTLTNLGLPSLPNSSTDGASWLALLPFLNNRDKVEAPSTLPSSRVYMYIRPTTVVK